MSASRTLTGARWSSAVRCIAMAEHQALGTEGDPEAQRYLEKHFKRGINVGKAWASDKQAELEALGHEVVLEDEIPWGLGWTAHTDLTDYTDKVVYEAFHAAGGVFREEKALQAAGSADELGPDWKAELAVIDTTDVSEDDGIGVQPYSLNVDGLRERVRDIKRRVVAAVEAGAVNPADKVGDTPFHSECRSCPFAQTCWQDWQPPAPDEVVGLEDLVSQYSIIDSDLHHASAKKASLEKMRDELRDELRPYTRLGVPLDAGTGVTVKRTEVAGRVSVRLGDFRKAGFTLPPELEPFVSEGQPSERWRVEATE